MLCVYPDFEDWRAQTTALDDMALVHGLGITLTAGSGFPEDYTVTEVTSNTFGIVGQKPVLGRDFTHVDEVPGAAPVVILRYSFWERRFAKDPGIIGRVVRCADDGDRRHAARVLVPAKPGPLGAARADAGGAATGSAEYMVRLRPSLRRCDDRERAGGHGRDRPAARTRLAGEQRGATP
ncbi:MAG TPA: hypothetical protein VFT29_01725 [Gemmatimonadaceae bacterium]|nr:hypothetical protein [Gemmatimonadaceae bacterium]